jgi:hypothetical protein
VLVLAALLLASSPPARGVFAALAGLAKFAPLALAPLLCTYGLVGSSGRAGSDDLGDPSAPGVSGGAGRSGAPSTARRPLRTVLLFSGAFALTVAVAAAIPALAHDSLHTIYERTLIYQSHRESPFSIWGLYGIAPTGGPAAVPWLSGVQVAVEVAAVVFAAPLALLPRRADLVGLAACAAAVLIAVQLGIDHWFYLYIPWFFGLVMLALLGRLSWAPESQRRSEQADAASGSARSSQLAAA